MGAILLPKLHSSGCIEIRKYFLIKYFLVKLKKQTKLEHLIKDLVL